MIIAPRILHEDDCLLVLDKPAGMPSVATSKGSGETLAAWILGRFPKQAALPKGEREAGLVHRLDNDTSGVIIAARTPEAYHHLRGQFEQGTVRKGYEALVVGVPPEEGAIDMPIAHHPRKKKKMVVCQGARQAAEWKGRPALTLFRRENIFEHRAAGGTCRYALLVVIIGAGARHQIRAHLASRGFPLVGDRLYQKPPARAADALDLPRHFLHAHSIAFVHPESGAEVEFSSPLPDELQAVLARLKSV